MGHLAPRCRIVPLAIRRCATIPPPWGLLTLGLLVLLPGDALVRLLFPLAPSGPLRAPGPGERIFLRLLGGTLLVGWWALVLAEAGAFAAPTVLLGVGAISAACYALALRRSRAAAPARPRGSPSRPTAGGAALAAVLLLAAVLCFGRPFETIVGAEDAGVYFNSGGFIAREGGILVRDPGLARFGDAAANARERGAARHLLLPPPGPQSGAADRFLFLDWQRLAGFNLVPGAPDLVTPQFLHLFPTWLALWAVLGGGPGAMVWGGPAFGLLGVVAAHFLARRLFGAAVGTLAALLLTLNGLQIWFARESLSEPLLQFLLLGALYAWVLFVEARDAGDKVYARGAALLAALALGSVALAHAQFLFALLPLAPLLAWLLLWRRWRPEYRWFFVPLVLLLAHATFHIARYALGYFEGIYHHPWTNAWRDRGQTALLILAPLALVALLDRTRARWLPILESRPVRRGWRPLGAAATALGAAYLYLVRPGILPFGSLEGYIGAPVPPGAAASLVSFGWYLSPLGMALAVAGLVALILRGLDERGAAVLGFAAPFAILFLSGTYTQAGYIYGLRRFVPLLLPIASILIAYAALYAGPALAGALRRPRLARPLRALGLAAIALLILFFAVTNARLVRHREYAGLLDQVGALAARFGPDDVLLFSGPRDEAQKLAAPLQYLFGRESWVISTNLPDGDALDAWVARQEAAGRQVHLLMLADGGKLFLPRHRLEPEAGVVITLRQFEKLDWQKPYNPQTNELRYSIYAPRPLRAGEAALGPLPYRVEAGRAGEFAQVGGQAGQGRGFYSVEFARAGDTVAGPFQWTSGDALLRVPWPGDGRPLTLTLTLDAGPQPAELGPAPLVVSLKSDPGASQERALGTLAVSRGAAEYTIEIPPDALAPSRDGTAIVRLAAPRTFDERKRQFVIQPGAVWKPSEFPVESGGSPDGRELHVRFIGASLIAADDRR